MRLAPKSREAGKQGYSSGGSQSQRLQMASAGAGGRVWPNPADPAAKAWCLLLEDPTDSYVIATTWCRRRNSPATSDRINLRAGRRFVDRRRRSDYAGPPMLSCRVGDMIYKTVYI